MTTFQNSKFFIFFAMFLAITNQTGNKNQLGVDQCSHEHFLVVNKFFEDSIWANFPNPTAHYKFVECSRETAVGTYLRQYVFAVQIGEVNCNFSFKVKDVVAEKTLANFSPVEVKDFNSCKHALEKAGLIAIKSEDPIAKINEVIADKTAKNVEEENWSNLKPLFHDIEENSDEDWSNLKPLFHDIESKSDEDWNNLKPLFHDIEDKSHEDIKNKSHGKLPTTEDKFDFDISSLFADEDKAYENKNAKKPITEEEVDLNASSLFADEDKAYETGSLQHKSHLLNKKDAAEPKVNNRIIEEDSEEDPVPEDNTPVKNFIAGGFNKCNKHTLLHIPNLFIALANDKTLKAVVVYSENITKCEVQIVKGMKYNVTVSLNDEVCDYTIYEDITGEVSLTSNLVEASPVCRSYFTANYIRSNAQLI